jgi:hypothetical protein
MSQIANMEVALMMRLGDVLTLDGQNLPKVEVRAWPDRPRDYRMTHPRGAALIVYRGSKYEHSATAGQLVKHDDEWEIGIISRTLREPNAGGAEADQGADVYSLIETCRDALLGWTPPGAVGPARLIEAAFDDYAEGTWGYHLSFAVPMMSVANRPRPPGPWPVANEDDAPDLVEREFKESDAV